MSAIDDFLNSAPKSRGKGTKLIIPNLDQPAPTTVKIPQSEKKWSPIFAKKLVAPIVKYTVDEPDAFFAFIQAFLSKYPHYEYLYLTKSKYSVEKGYWFMDKERNVIVIMTIKEVKKKLSKAHQYVQKLKSLSN